MNPMDKSPKHETTELPYALRDKREIKGDESFGFGCHAGLPCFTDCCADVNIFLTPVDVLRLSRRLGVTTTEFLDQHVLVPITKDLHLPVVVLRMGDDDRKRCRFVGDQGCTVYQDRPWSCRMYPLGMAIPPARAGEEPAPRFFLFEDGFCKGHGEGAVWTAESWRRDQGVAEQEDLEIGYRELVSHPWFIGGRQLDPKRMEMFYTSCYDLDTFRRFVFESTFLDRFEIEEDLIEKLRGDDEALLAFAFRWLRFALFGEPTLTVRKDENQPGSSQ
jgi:Fe-S-cluster containining protein